MRRKAWIALAALPVLLLVGDTLYWNYAAQQLEAGFAAWRADRQAAGWTVSSAAPRVSGWPFHSTLTLDGMTLAGGEPGLPGGLHWQAERLTLGVSLWRPMMLKVAAAGRQRLRLGTGPEIEFAADSLHATLLLERTAPPHQVRFSAANLRAQPSGATPGNPSVTIGRLGGQADLAPDPGDGASLAFAVTAEPIELTPSIRWPLGRQIDSLRVEGALNGSFGEGGSLTERASAWRDGGGSLEIRHAALHWGKLDLSGTATLALDPQLQPMGTGTARLVGYADTLDALASKGVLSRSAATAAKAVLSLMAQPSDDDQTSEVEVPLTLQYRTLSMRQVPLVRLPELDWLTP